MIRLGPCSRYAAVQLLKPTLPDIAIPKRTLNNQAKLTAWLAEVVHLVTETLKDGPVAL